MRPSQRYQDLTTLRERARKLELARAAAAAQKARDAHHDELSDLHAAREAVRGAVGDASISAAYLAMASGALGAHERAVTSAEARVRAAEAPESEARLRLSTAATDRLVADRWVERERRDRIQTADRKADREASDRAGARTDGAAPPFDGPPDPV